MLTVLSRQPSAARSTHPLFDLRVRISSEEAVLDAVGKAAPEHERAVYRQLTGERFPGPRLFGEAGDLLVLARVAGTPLWQFTLPAWVEAARCLGRLHAEADVGQLPARAGWWAGRLLPTLAAAPLVVVHGEAYPANVLVAPDGATCLLDWESAAAGPAALDVAALVVGWPDDAVAAMLDGYAQTAPEPMTRPQLAAARLLWARRWLAHRGPLVAPSGTVDWRREADLAAKELACVS